MKTDATRSLDCNHAIERYTISQDLELEHSALSDNIFMSYACMR